LNCDVGLDYDPKPNVSMRKEWRGWADRKKGMVSYYIVGKGEWEGLWKNSVRKLGITYSDLGHLVLWGNW
jgi:hypothetical protein